jgi:serine/threonine-protein kinase
MTLPSHLGRYEILSNFALGGMAELLLARLAGPNGFERAVVIKRILPQFSQHPPFVQMFLEEGRVAARISHPNVVQVHELAQEGGDLFLVMEYLQGESLAGVARRLHARALTLSPTLAAYIVAAASAGLHAAHELCDANGRPMDVVHRDVSPQNLFVTYDGGVKVLDFGIAKVSDRVSQTEQGTIKGKLEYMSPEQARGEPLDRRSDVFGLGVVLHELLAQRRLFRRPNPVATWNAVCQDPIPPPSEFNAACPPALDAICLKALARDPSLRFQSALELRRALLEWLQGSPDARLPEEALASLMGSLFAARIADKRRVVEQLRASAAPLEVPQGEVDLAVELPSVIEQRAEPMRALVQPSRVRRRWIGVLGVSVVVVGALAVWLAPRQPAPSAAPAQRAVLPAPEKIEPKKLEPEPMVSLTIETTPAGATVQLDGRTSGVTPLTLEVLRSSQSVTLRLEHSGHEPLVEQLIPDVTQRVRYVLQPTKPPSRKQKQRPPPPAPTTKPAPAEEPQFRRFN